MENEKFVPQIQVRSDVCSGAASQYGWNPGGGYVNGVWFPDRSGICGGVVPPFPTVPTVPTIPPDTPTSGGYINGVWYSDRSGVCG